jgi:hypothetical protein
MAAELCTGSTQVPQQHQPGVHPDQQTGHDRVGHGPRDQPVDVVQPVRQHRHGVGQRDTSRGRAGYYAWRNRGPSAHAVRDAELTEKIREVDEEQKHRCGIERILWELQEDGLRTSQRRVGRLARAAGWSARLPLSA